MLDALEELELVEHVSPVQLGIRLLIPNGSRLLELDDIRRAIRSFDPRQLAYAWTHPDPQVDALQRDVMTLVRRGLAGSRSDVFGRVRVLARGRAGVVAPLMPAQPPRIARAAVPYLDEPWYC